MKYLQFCFIFFIFSSNVNANQLMDVATKADNLKAAASTCYLSVLSSKRHAIAKLYLRANKTLDDGVGFIKSNQIGTAISMLQIANGLYVAMIGFGRQLGGNSC